MCTRPLIEFTVHILKTLWPSGLRRWLKAPVRKGVGSNPTGVIVADLTGLLTGNDDKPER